MPNKRKKPERVFSVLLTPSVARDLVVVLEKFSNHKHEQLQ